MAVSCTLRVRVCLILVSCVKKTALRHWVWLWCRCMEPSHVFGKSVPGGEWTMQPVQWHDPEPAKNNEKVSIDLRSQYTSKIVRFRCTLRASYSITCLSACLDEDRPEDWIWLRKGTDSDVLQIIIKYKQKYKFWLILCLPWWCDQNLNSQWVQSVGLT